MRNRPCWHRISRFPLTRSSLRFSVTILPTRLLSLRRPRVLAKQATSLSITITAQRYIFAPALNQGKLKSAVRAMATLANPGIVRRMDHSCCALSFLNNRR
jgi:hypothetical protein